MGTEPVQFSRQGDLVFLGLYKHTYTYRGPNKHGWKLCHNTCFILSTTSKQVRNRQNVKTNIAFPPKNRAESFITLAGLARLM